MCNRVQVRCRDLGTQRQHLLAALQTPGGLWSFVCSPGFSIPTINAPSLKSVLTTPPTRSATGNRPSRKVCKSDGKRGPSQAAPSGQARPVRSLRASPGARLGGCPGASPVRPRLALHPLLTHTHLPGCERSPGTCSRARRPGAARPDAVIGTPAPQTSLPSPATPPAPALGGGGACWAPPSRPADGAGRALRWGRGGPRPEWAGLGGGEQPAAEVSEIHSYTQRPTSSFLLPASNHPPHPKQTKQNNNSKSPPSFNSKTNCHIIGFLRHKCILQSRDTLSSREVIQVWPSR